MAFLVNICAFTECTEHGTYQPDCKYLRIDTSSVRNNVLCDLAVIELNAVAACVQGISILDILKVLRNEPTPITEGRRLSLAKHYSFN